MLTLPATGVVHHRGGQRGRLDQSEEAKRRGRLRPHVVRGHHPGEEQQRCRHLHLTPSAVSSLLSHHPPPSTLPSLLSISHPRDGASTLCTNVSAVPSPLISISVLFVPPPPPPPSLCLSRLAGECLSVKTARRHGYATSRSKFLRLSIVIY